MKNMTPLQESISKCTINGNIVNLPFEQLTNYADLRKAFLNAGAKYKNNTFIFPSEAEPYINRLMGGESVNIKKEFQFYGTPDNLADKLVRNADINDSDLLILEPSAGQGAIIKALHRIFPGRKIQWCELMPINQTVLFALQDKQTFIQPNFLEYTGDAKFNKIIANPPFNKNQDIDHILKMWDCLADNGRIVTIASKHWQNSKNKKETAFREFLNVVNAVVTEIPTGEFSESGTKIATCKIIIDKI